MKRAGFFTTKTRRSTARAWPATQAGAPASASASVPGPDGMAAAEAVTGAVTEAASVAVAVAVAVTESASGSPRGSAHGHLRVVHEGHQMVGVGPDVKGRQGRRTTLDIWPATDWEARHERPGGDHRRATRQSNLIASETALEAAGMAIQLVLRVPAPLKSLADQVVRSASSVAATRAASGDPRMWAWGSKRVGGCPTSARRSGRVAAPMGREQSIGGPGPVRPGPDAALADRVRPRARGGVPPAAADPCRSRKPLSGQDGAGPLRLGAGHDMAAAASDSVESTGHAAVQGPSHGPDPSPARIVVRHPRCDPGTAPCTDGLATA